MTLAGKYGMGVLSIASNSTEGIQALPTQWSFAEDAAEKHGQTVDRKNWRVMMAFHLAESSEQARNEAVDGLQRWHNEYNVYTLGRPNATAVDDKWELLDQTTGDGAVGRWGGRRSARPTISSRASAISGGHGRFRCRARLRPRLGEPRGDAAVVGPAWRGT